MAETSRLTVRGCSIKLMRGGEGAPLVILHGASGAGAWLPFMQSLAERFDVMAQEVGLVVLGGRPPGLGVRELR